MADDRTQSTRSDENADPAAERADLATAPGFDLRAEIGRGGMGIVYRALDRALDREVAVKLLHDKYAPDSAAAGRFLDEARITGQLQHPGIPAVYQVGRLADGRPFLAMKLIKGDTLAALLRANAPVDVLAVFAAVAQAVGYAHAHGVIHRDLKPSNVMVGAFGEVQVMDWGLAKVLAVGQSADPDRPAGLADTVAPTEVRPLRGAETPFTEAGSVIGTPAFMAPEQAAGEIHKVDARSDVFGLGAVMCAVLTGRPPFTGADAEAVRLNAVRGRTADALARLDASGADPGLVALCKRCLAVEPADRPADGAAVADAVAALRRAADDRARQAELAAARAEVYAAEQRKRRRVLVAAAGALAAVLAAGVIGTSVGLVRAERKRAEAEQSRVRAETTEAETAAVLGFVEDRVFAAARPAGQQGGLGRDVTLRQALEAAVPALDAFRDQPLTEARLRMTLGLTYGHLGEWRTAEGHFRRARELYVAHGGADHPSALRATARLAWTLRPLNRLVEALALAEEAAARQAAQLGPDHADTLWSKALLVRIDLSLGRNAEATALAEEVVERRRRTSGADHADTLFGMGLLADCYLASGRAAEAAALREKVVARQRATLPANHPDTLWSARMLGACYVRLGKTEEALTLYRQVLNDLTTAVGPDHPATLDAAWALTLHLQRSDRPDDARRVAGDSIRAAAGREGDPTVATYLVQLRVLVAELNRDAAEFRRTLDKWEAARTPTSAIDLYDMGCCTARLSVLTRDVVRTAAGAKQADADADRAMDWLRKAVAAGYRNLANMETDPDLDALRGRDDFRQLVASLRPK